MSALSTASFLAFAESKDNLECPFKSEEKIVRIRVIHISSLRHRKTCEEVFIRSCSIQKNAIDFNFFQNFQLGPFLRVQGRDIGVETKCLQVHV